MTVGTFCGVVRHSGDQDAAARFYTALFGWHTRRGATMTRCTLNQQPVAAIGNSVDGVERWVPYVAVEDVEQAATRAVALGGGRVQSVAAAAGAAPEAVMADPEGAVFGLRRVTADDQDEVLVDVPGATMWIETLAQVPEAAQRYYGGLFGWTFIDRSLPPHARYIIAVNDGVQVTGILPIGPDWGVRPRWQVIFEVEHLEASTANAIAAGGKVDFGPLQVADVGRLTSLRDSLGALFVVMQPTRRT